jgi:hypothetical protein
VEISAALFGVPFDDALTVLRQWGHGCEARRYQEIGRCFCKDGEKYIQIVEIDKWLVEEVCAVTDQDRAEYLKQTKKASAPSPV